jgi:D-sorbitol dehydrogenase (acceptor)
MTNTAPQFGRLLNKHAILTGAGGGIGAAVTAAYLREGANCSVVDLPTVASDEVQDLSAKYPGQVNYISADVTKSADIARLVQQASDAFGPIHILYNNAAIFDMAPLLESDESMFDKMFAVNVKGAFFVMQKVLEHMALLLTWLRKLGVVARLWYRTIAPPRLPLSATRKVRR